MKKTYGPELDKDDVAEIVAPFRAALSSIILDEASGVFILEPAFGREPVLLPITKLIARALETAFEGDYDL